MYSWNPLHPPLTDDVVRDVRVIYHPRTNQQLLVVPKRLSPSGYSTKQSDVFLSGASPAPDPPAESFTLDDIHKALRRVTPSLLLLGIATGAAFAIGSGLVSRLIFGEGKRG